MKRIILLTLLMYLFSTHNYAQVKIGGKTIDTKKAIQAGKDGYKAATLKDEDIIKLSKEAVDWMDANNPIADETTEYGQRLERLTANIKEYKGLKLNYKVYHVIDINAFACGDGSVRVFSSLMDIMTDNELMAIIGHEIGHIANTDVKDAMKNAYVTSAAINAAGATEGTLAKLSNSQIGELASGFSNAKFSRKQENEADDYAFQFCIDNGVDPYAMALALEKLVELSNGAKSTTIEKMFSSHPDSEKRAVRMREKADKHLDK